MKCDLCDLAPATIHITRIVEGKKCKSHLCQNCAAENGQHKTPINLPALLQVLLGQNDMAQMDCPCCGIGFMEFRANGRLGCPHDYEAFRKGLNGLLRRLHSKIIHKGKRPGRPVLDNALSQKLLTLRRAMSQAVSSENYEEAARLKREIQQLSQESVSHES